MIPNSADVMPGGVNSVKYVPGAELYVLNPTSPANLFPSISIPYQILLQIPLIYKMNKRLVLHFDINGTITPVDTTEPGSKEENANMVIAKSVYGEPSSVHSSHSVAPPFQGEADFVLPFDVRVVGKFVCDNYENEENYDKTFVIYNYGVVAFDLFNPHQKFIINKDGKVVCAIAPRTTVKDQEFVQNIEDLLK